MFRSHRNHRLAMGKATAMAMAMSGALMAMAAARADTVISAGQTETITQTWSIGNFTVSTLGAITVPAGSGSAISASGSVGTLTNNGTIAGVVANNDSISGIVNAGLLQGGIFGIGNDGTIGSVTNSGTISGAYAIYNNSDSAKIGSIINTGTISSTRYGIYYFGTIGSLVNEGLIQGDTSAIYTSALAVLPDIINTGTIAGAITNSGPAALTITGGTGTIFGTLTGASGGISANAVGNIVSLHGVRFNGGNQLLNDNINAGTGTVTNAGTLQVNNPLSITGNYAQDAQGSLSIGVANGALANGVTADTGYGRLTVSGSVVLAAGSGVALTSLSTYSFAAGQRYLVIRAAAAGTNYNESTLNYSIAGANASAYSLSGLAVADGSFSNLLVTVSDVATGSSGIIRRATNDNAGRALNGLFNYTGSNQALLDVFNPAVALGDAGSANRAGSQLSPAATGSAAINGANAAFGAVQSAAGSRLDTLRTAQGNGGSGVATGESTLSTALWGKVFGGHAKQDERDGIAGYHANYGGFLIGSDAKVASDWRAGGLFSYARVSVGNEGNNSGSSASVNGYGLTGYASYDGHPWYLNLTAGVARQQYSTDRAVSFSGFSGNNHGSFNGVVYTTSAQAGYPLAVGASTFTPLAGLSYTALRQGGYTETGSAAALSVNGSRSTSLKSDIALKWEHSLATSYGELKPFAQLGWRHEFHATPLTTTAIFAADTTGTTAFSSQGASALRNTGVLSLGATLLKTRNLSVAARYSLEAAAGYRAQAGDVMLRWEY